MLSSTEIMCDGCGQPATQAHIARRLKRLENATRYRPIHVQTLFVGAASPAEDRADLYSAQEAFTGEGAELLRALAVEHVGRSVEATLTEFQRRGYLLAHVLDCGQVSGEGAVGRALARRMPATLTRIRRSFKPKRVVLLGAELAEFVPQFRAADLDAALILQNGGPFKWTELGGGSLAKELDTPAQAL
jgi:hypothetical protein